MMHASRCTADAAYQEDAGRGYFNYADETHDVMHVDTRCLLPTGYVLEGKQNRGT